MTAALLLFCHPPPRYPALPRAPSSGFSSSRQHPAPPCSPRARFAARSAPPRRGVFAAHVSAPPRRLVCAPSARWQARLARRSPRFRRRSASSPPQALSVPPKSLFPRCGRVTTPAPKAPTPTRRLRCNFPTPHHTSSATRSSRLVNRKPRLPPGSAIPAKKPRVRLLSAPRPGAGATRFPPRAPRPKRNPPQRRARCGPRWVLAYPGPRSRTPRSEPRAALCAPRPPGSSAAPCLAAPRL
mmetsp:Transcript_10242/g.37940  ORF Transcript_10242/g.37940 Transcript_10242/m.37940 type:complete len:241 (-) Transcript_10242:1024-1746(-)